MKPPRKRKPGRKGCGPGRGRRRTSGPHCTAAAIEAEIARVALDTSIGAARRAAATATLLRARLAAYREANVLGEPPTIAGEAQTK
jgi:hypothetical protein